MNIKITGAKGIQKQLDKRIKITSKNSTEGLQEIGLRGVGILKGNSPTLTGRLKGSMGYTIEGQVKFPEPPHKEKDKISINNKKDIVFLGTNVIYAWLVENLSKTGSAGFMLRSFNQLKPIARMIYIKSICSG